MNHVVERNRYPVSNFFFGEKWPFSEKKYPEIAPKQHITAPKPLERALLHVESTQSRAFAFLWREVCVYMQVGAALSRVCVLLGGGDPELLTRDITLKKKKIGEKKKRMVLGAGPIRPNPSSFSKSYGAKV